MGGAQILGLFFFAQMFLIWGVLFDLVWAAPAAQNLPDVGPSPRVNIGHPWCHAPGVGFPTSLPSARARRLCQENGLARERLETLAGGWADELVSKKRVFL